MTVAGQYKTKPLESWGRAKELRQDYFRDVATAREKGKLVVTGGTEGFLELPSGLGEYVYLGGEPYGASIAAMPEFALQCEEVVEAKGFARDLCGYMRNYWGSMLLNRYAFGGPFPKPDFVFQMHECDTHAKWFQFVAEYFGVPYFAVDMPITPDKKKGAKARREYIVGQLHDAIEWMEKITKRKYDDEKLIEGVKNVYCSLSYWAECFIFNQAIPAPMDEKTMYSLYVPSVVARNKKEVADFYKMLRDEIRDRAANHIAALSAERLRVITDSPPPWYALDVFRYLEKYGVICVGSTYTSILGNALREKEDGILVAAKTLEESGKAPKSREDALQLIADLWFDHPAGAILRYPEVKIDIMKKLVKQWHADAVIQHLNRGCEGFANGQMEVRLALLEEGIPVMTYEGNMADPREFDMAATVKRIDAFMESLNLKKLED